jgi:hypothetical protein
MKIHVSGSDLFHVNGQTDMKKLIVRFAIVRALMKLSLSKSPYICRADNITAVSTVVEELPLTTAKFLANLVQYKTTSEFQTVNFR